MRSSNSKFPADFMFKDRVYDSPYELFDDVHPRPTIKLATFCGRIRRLVMANNLTESSVADALYLDADQYKSRYAVRKTWVKVADQHVALCDYFDRAVLQRAVSYSNFRTRVKSLQYRELLDSASINHALKMSYVEWVSFYGGGRKREFFYEGDEFPEQSGKVFPSITAFLRTIGRYGDKNLIWSRLKSGWYINTALSIPATISSLSPGLIYLLTRKSTGQVYVGLTVCGLAQRWAFHVFAACRGSTTKLARAIREDGENGFERSVLENDIVDTEILREREIFWATECEALGANGLNTLKPGGLGGPRGIETTVDNQKYRSRNEAARCEAKARHIPPHVVRSCVVKGLPIPSRPRTHSKHPEAGTSLWRRWQALLRRHPNDVVESWICSYDTFKADVDFNDSSLHLVRIRVEEPWGPQNFNWLTWLQKIEKQHGKPIYCNGVFYPTLKSLAHAFGIKVSTLKDRIRRQGLSVEDAVSASLITAVPFGGQA